MPKYYIYKTKEQLGEAVSAISGLPGPQWTEAIPQLERQYRVTIVYDDWRKRENDLNESLQQQLAKKKVTLSKFWVTDASLKKAIAGSRVNKIYDQGKLNPAFTPA
ncbi:hypothetical protein VQ056_18395 [Paenibacillus sp. JTLBN-2024]